MDILQAARILRPGTSWIFSAEVLSQAEDGTPRVTVPTLSELQSVMDSDTTPQAVTGKQRSGAVSQLLSDRSSSAKLIRSILLIVLDEINILRQRDVNRSLDVAAATTLADLKTRWAARSSLQDRTSTQFLNAVESKINSGESD